MDKIPKSIQVLGALILGVFLIVYMQAPHSVCDSQANQLRESLKGKLYPAKGPKGETLFPVFNKAVESCKWANSAGGCYDLFQLVKRVHREVAASDPGCLSKMVGQPEVGKAYSETLEILVKVAWGEFIPEGQLRQYNWLESPDLALFCQLKAHLREALGNDGFQKFQQRVLAELPGEKPILKDGKCENCESRKRAIDLLSSEQVWAKSLFSVRCESL